MTLLAPWNMVVAASIAIPALLILYMLRLRRRRLRISSSLLWTGSVRDLEGNVPFQRVRPSWMFFLQLLALLLLLLAMGDPVLTGGTAPAMRTVIAIDTSASMSIRVGDGDDAPRRFDLAIAEAQRLARQALVPGSNREVMLVVLGARPRLLLGFDQRLAAARAALSEVEPTDEPLDATASLRFVQSLLRGSEFAGTAEVVILSDGAFSGVGAVGGRSVDIPGRVRWVDLSADAPPPVNLGIVAIGARRDPEETQRVGLIVTLATNAPQRIDTILEVLVNGRVAATRSVRIGGDDPETVERFELNIPGPATIIARHRASDALVADDSAAIVLDRPRRPAIALVHAAPAPDPWLRRLLEDLDLEELQVIEADDDDAAEIPERRRELLDLVIFDRVAPARWPSVPLLIVGAAGPELERTARAGSGARRILAWDRTHPLLRHAVLDDLAFTAAARTLAPSDARVLATDAEGASLFTLRRSGAEHVVLNFSPAQSTWPADVSFAIFGRNLIDFVVTDGYGAIGRFARAGDTLDLVAESERIELRGAAPRTVRAQPGQVVQVPVPSRVGMYEVDGARGVERLAVNLLSREESLRRREAAADAGAEIEFGVAAADDDGAEASETGRSIARWLLLAAFAVLVTEWLLYLRINRF